MGNLRELFDEVVRLQETKGDGVPFRLLLDEACLTVRQRRERNDRAFLRRMAGILKRPLPGHRTRDKEIISFLS